MPTRRSGRTAHEIVTVPPARVCASGHALRHPNVSVGLGQPPSGGERVLGWTCRTCDDTVWDEQPPRRHT